ncbi:hypothetical protein [Burkholderia multivorans]|uniref:hypothetical protein n=1 Tax=Burkholderia multivorans TaxID=87883 RepID=UPI001C244D33|nr:hypothetical protein [Burkholderia multivorans]MBU9553872.1 hypothetical protein [Burkholderia multivorans]
MDKGNKNNKDKNVMVPVKEETIILMREVREREHFNWSAYLRDCIEEKLNRFDQSKK